VIDDRQVEKALQYLSDTDESHANAKASVKGLEQRRKTIHATAFLSANGANVAEREARALVTPEYKEYLDNYELAVYEEQILKKKRKRAELTVDVFRSMNAAHRRGNV